MADYHVTRTGKDRDGDITRLCGEGWSVSKDDAIRHIDNGQHRFYTQAPYGAPVWVVVVDGRYRRHLRTDPNLTVRDNLDNLPDC